MFVDEGVSCSYQPVALGGQEEGSSPKAVQESCIILPVQHSDQKSLHCPSVWPRWAVLGYILVAMLSVAVLLLGVQHAVVALEGRALQFHRSFSSVHPRLMMEAGESLAQRVKECLNSYDLSDFSSKDKMQQSGWLFGWTGDDTFKPDTDQYVGLVSENSYWGFSEFVDAEIALVLRGEGFVRLDFGNAFSGSRSQVVVFLNGVPMSRAGADTPSKLLEMPFNAGDVLRLVEDNGVIVINSIIFNCAGISVGQVPPESSTSMAESADIAASTTTTPRVSASATASSTSTSTLSTRSSSRPFVNSTHSVAAAEKIDEDFGEKAEASALDEAKKLWERAQRQMERKKAQEMSELAELEALKHKTEQQVQSESLMSSKLAQTAQQLEQLENEERAELEKAQEDRQQQELLQQQLEEANQERRVLLRDSHLGTGHQK